MRCTARKDFSVTPFGYHGRFRCPNEAVSRATAYSAGGKQVGRFVLCADHLPSGSPGIGTPTGWRWSFDPLAVVR